MYKLQTLILSLLLTHNSWTAASNSFIEGKSVAQGNLIPSFNLTIDICWEANPETRRVCIKSVFLFAVLILVS